MLDRVGGAQATERVVDRVAVHVRHRLVAAFAGETTAAEIAFRFLANVRLSEALAWLFGASGIGFGYLQRGLRERARRESEEERRRNRRQNDRRG